MFYILHKKNNRNKLLQTPKSYICIHIYTYIIIKSTRKKDLKNNNNWVLFFNQSLRRFKNNPNKIIVIKNKKIKIDCFVV